MKTAQQSGPRPHSQWTIVCASGEKRKLAWSSVSQQDNAGKYSGILAIGADITEGINAQQELQCAQREIEHLSRISLLGELASTLAHELKQPLTAVLSNAQAASRFMLDDQVDMDELRGILEDIVRDDKRAGEVIHRMRAMLRKGDIVRERFELQNTVDQVVTILHHELETQSIRVETDYPGNPLTVEAGRVEIQQVLMNLLLNAARAMQSLPVKQRVIHISANQQQSNLVMVVKDNGAGIPPQHLSTVFTAFYSTQLASMGMGLTICKRIIEAHHGKIWVENSPQGGAKFSFTLPIQSNNE